MGSVIINSILSVSPVEFIVIVLLKTIEVAISTLRIILINKGYRREGTILSFIEIMLFIFVASRVIMGIAEQPMNGIAYSIGFSIGVYLGSKIEAYIAMGRILIQAIVSKENSMALIQNLREKGYGVTSIDAEGRDSAKAVLMIFANRKGKEEIINDIHNLDSTAMIITNDVTTLYGGRITAVKRFFK